MESNPVASHPNASNLTFEVVNNQLPHGGSVIVYSDSSNIQGQELDWLQSIDENIPTGLESFQSKFAGKYGSQHGIMCDARLRWRASAMTGFEAANEVSHGGFEEHTQKFGKWTWFTFTIRPDYFYFNYLLVRFENIYLLIQNISWLTWGQWFCYSIQHFF